MTSERLALERGLAAAHRALEIEAQAVAAVGTNISGSLPAALRLLAAISGKVVVSGIGKSGHIGAKVAASLASTGTPSFFVHSTEALHGDSGMVEPHDAAILISNSGETVEVCAFARMLHRRNIPIIAMAAREESTLAQLGDVFLNIAVKTESDPLNLAPTASTAATLVIGDALVAGLMEMRGFTADDFAMYHPGGSLGNMLSGEGTSQ